jgi:predicted metal-dependent hydrolase
VLISGQFFLKLKLKVELMDPRFHHGADLFNRGKFFDAHEVWEDVWREAPFEQKRFLQGLIQIAVALHHYSRGNVVGARSLLARADTNLAMYPETHAGIRVADVRRQLACARNAVEHGQQCSIRIEIGKLNED